MKATAAGPVVGIAMTAFSGTSSTDQGQIIVYIENSYYNPFGATVLQGSTATFDNIATSGGLNVGGSLNVSGPTTLTDLSVTGSVSIANNLTVQGMTTVGNITINGHIITSGSTPTITALAAAGTNATATITGNDTAGTITITTGGQSMVNGIAQGNNPTIGELVKVAFAKSYTQPPTVVITPGNQSAALLQVYVNPANNNFNISSASTSNLSSNTNYIFFYHTMQ
jgi:hypothetical protein